MPLSKHSAFISFLFIFTISTMVFAQNEPKSTSLADLKNAKPPKTKTSAEIMRDRITKAKAYLVVKNYGAAVYELENIRQETGDKTVHRVLNVLLMHAYLEQGDHVKAQNFLKELHKSKSATAPIDYLAVAGQVVSGAKTQLERYKSLGLSVADRNLPVEASADVEDMRKTLELIVDQSKVLSKNQQVSANAFALLEETSSVRSSFAKDAYDAKRWNDTVADAREQLVNPNSKIIDAVDNPPIDSPSVNIVSASDVVLQPLPEEVPVKKEEVKKDPDVKLKPVAKNNELTPKETENVLPKDRGVKIITSEKSKEVKQPETKKQPNVKSNITKKPVENNVAKVVKKAADDSPLPVGSLIGFATKRVNPVYPRQARNLRMTGTVTVEVLVDKDGKVTKVENTKGPTMLRRAARDAVKKWQFKPFERDGQPVEAKGFVSFNFNL